MFVFNVKKVMRLRGVEHHQHFMAKLGIVPSSANNFLNGTATQIKFDQLERLCVALNCTPNDLLEWQPSADQMVAETHSLNNLKRKTDKDLPALLGEVPLEKFEQIADILQDLKNK